MIWRDPIFPNGVITHYTVYCSESSTFNVSLIGNGTTAYSTSVQVVGLDPYTVYSCVVTASTSAGESNFSLITSTRTDESGNLCYNLFIALLFVLMFFAEPGSPPTNLQISSATSSSVTITWGPPLTPNGVIVSYTVSYSSSTEMVSIVLHNPMQTTHRITSLRAFTNYKISVYASTRIGGGPSASVVKKTEESSNLFLQMKSNVCTVAMYVACMTFLRSLSNSATVPTSYLGPSAPPEDIQFFVTGSTTATVTWSPPPVDDQNGVVVYYSLTIEDLQFNARIEVINSTNSTYYLTGLNEFNEYRCRIAAATIKGLGPYSQAHNFTTYQDGNSANVLATLCIVDICYVL